MFESGFERAFFVGIALLAAACGRSRRVYVARVAEPSTQTVRIGAYASLTGKDAGIGTAEQRGFELAVDEWNAGARAQRLRVELVTYDDQSRPAGAATAVQRLTSEDHTVLVAGGSDTERAELAAASAQGALVVCPVCKTTETGSVIGLAPSLRERADLLADLVVKTMNMTKLAILVRRDNANDHAAAEAFRSSLKSRNVSTGDALPFTAETIADVLARMVTDAPQAVLVAFDGNEAALVGRAMRRRAVPSALLFIGTPNIDVLPEADRAAALEGALFPSVFAVPHDDATSRRFLEAFASRHATQPNERAWLGYAAGRRVLEALLAAASNPALDTRSALVAAHPIAALAVVRVEHGTFVRALPPQH